MNKATILNCTDSFLLSSLLGPSLTLNSHPAMDSEAPLFTSSHIVAVI